MGSFLQDGPLAAPQDRAGYWRSGKGQAGLKASTRAGEARRVSPPEASRRDLSAVLDDVSKHVEKSRTLWFIVDAIGEPR